MSPTGVLGRKRFWAGALCALIGAGGLYFGRALAPGTLAAPGPGAFPLALAALALLYGAVELMRGIFGPYRPLEEDPPLWRRPGAMAAAALAVALTLLAFFGPLSPYFAHLGQGTSLAWYGFVLIVCAGAAAHMPGGSPARALGAVILGLLLGTSGIDPLTPGLERYAAIDSRTYFGFAPALVFALVAYHVGFNALLMAAAVALSPKIEVALRQGLAGTKGDVVALFGQPDGLALLGGTALALVLAAAIRPRPPALRVSATGHTIVLAREPLAVARPGIFAGIAAILLGAAGLYFGAGLGIRESAAFPGALGPGAAPLALSAALVGLGALLLASAVRSTPALPQQPLSRAPATIVGTLLLAALIVLAVGAPYLFVTIGWPPMDFVVRLGPPEIAALAALVVTLWTVAVWLLPRGSFLRGLGALAIGLLLSTVGLDPATGVIRYTHELQLEAVHGLVLGFAAYRLGFNPLLIAVGFLYGERLENAVRQTMIMTQGDVSIFVDREISLWLLAAALSAWLVGAVLRFWQWRLARADVWGGAER
jgi:putative tricarboxylic transport membrane protein